MKVIFFLVAGFLSLAYMPIAFPIVLILAVIAMLESHRKKSKKAIIVEALKETGVSSSMHLAPTKQRKLSFGKFVGFVFLALFAVIAINSWIKVG